ncbi:MAG TPA: GIY-YIG nuclease family protein, partial [Ignavibacteria bacterium]|nr:GIY-YIG nuclease family protein [Ignavibacteria bacterium]
TQKLEQLLHNFFGKACLNIDIYDKAGNRHMPREWFVAPLSIIEQAVHYIISGEIVNYRYDSDSELIIPR